MSKQKFLDFILLKSEDILFIKNLLSQNDLPNQDIEDNNVKIFALKEDNNLIGTIGIEEYGKIALLRSMVTDEKYRGQGYGKILFDEIIKYSKNKRINELYLLTCTAHKYFEKLGFQELSRNDVPKEIKKTKQFSELCPCSAVCMILKI